MPNKELKDSTNVSDYNREIVPVIIEKLEQLASTFDSESQWELANNLRFLQQNNFNSRQLFNIINILIENMMMQREHGIGTMKTFNSFSTPNVSLYHQYILQRRPKQNNDKNLVQVQNEEENLRKSPSY